MALQLPRAQLVSPGDPITSDQLESLAEAFNYRLRNGLGDGTWRIHFYIGGLFSQIRNSNGGFLFPAKGEFLEAWQMLRPEQGEFPVADAGEPEGANVSSPLPAYVFGNESADLDPEHVRLGIPLEYSPPTGNAILDAWLLGEQQRGAWDPVSGAVASPALDAARSFSSIRYSRLSPHGNSYGGFMPRPDELATACDQYESDLPPPINYKIQFTRLSDSHVVTYDGTCKQGTLVPPPDYDSHVFTVIETEWAYYVILNDGTVDAYDKELWIEGPYKSATHLIKRDGNYWTHVFHHFIRDFRGIEQNGFPDNPAAWNRTAFAMQRFLTTQYLLAPAFGEENGPGVDPIPREFTWPTGPVAVDQTGNFSGGGTEWEPHASCTATAWLAYAPGLTAPATINCIVGGAIVSRAHLTPDDPAAIVKFADNSDYRSIQFQTGTAVQIPAEEILVVGGLELMTYKPRIHDLFLALRIMGAR